MRLLSVALLFFTVSMFSTGCIKSVETKTVVSDEQIKSEINDAIVKFLTAVKSGNDKDVFAMMTPTARTVCGKEIIARLPANDTAKFVVDEIKLLGNDQAQVRTTMIDTDHKGNQIEDPLGWAMKKNDEGWGVAGAAFVLFEGMEPIVINFENAKEIEKAQATAESQAKKYTEDVMKMQAELDSLQPTTQSPNDALNEVQVGTTRTQPAGN